MGNRSAIFSTNTPGGPQNIVDVANHPYDVYFIDSSNSNASDAAGYGNSPDIPLASIDYLFTLATANKKVVGYVLPGHTESYTTTGTKVTGDIAGVHIKGLGQGSDRPTITFSHTGSTWSITAANITIENILFVSGIDSIVTFGTISGNDCKMIDCETRDTTDIEVIDAFKITGDRFKAVRHFHNGYSSGNANARVFSLNGVESAIFDDCVFYTKVTTAVIGMVSNASNNIIVKNSSFLVSGTSDFSKTVVDEITGSTWEVTNCFDIAAGSTFSGGSGSALAAIDTTGLAAAIAVVDGFHDVPSADSANNNQIRDVVGNKTDTANATGSLVRMIKHIISLIGTPAGADTATDIAAIKTVVDAIATYVDTEVSVIDGYHDVPAQNTANNNQMRDVIGNKTDTSGGGDSIVALVKAVKDVTDAIPDSGALTTIDAYFDVTAAADSAANTTMRDVVGRKDDTVAGDSIIAILKQILVDTGTTLDGAISTIDGFHDVPAQNSANNAQARDVIGNKTDTTAGNSLYSVLLQILEDTGTTLDAFMDVPAQNSADNNQFRDVIGNKTDTTAGDSIYALLLQAAADLGDYSGRTNLQTSLAVLGNPDTAGATTWSALIGSNTTYDSRKGTKVTRAKADVLDGVQNAIFTVAGGRVEITHIEGEICDGAVDAESADTKFIYNPTVGATDTDMCAVGALDAAPVGTIFSITGTLSDALQFGPSITPAMAKSVVIAEGTIDIQSEADNAQDNSATVSFEIWYKPLDSGASITAV